MSETDSIFQRAVSKLLTEIFDGPPGTEVMQRVISGSLLPTSRRLNDGDIIRLDLDRGANTVNYDFSINDRASYATEYSNVNLISGDAHLQIWGDRPGFTLVDIRACITS